MVQSLGGIAVLVGIYFAWMNLKSTQEAQKATQDNQTKTLAVTNEGQITDRFTKAIDQLGSPQLELRLGGIYALGGIANESAQYHWPIIEIPTTYIRVHAPIKKSTEEQPSAAATLKPKSDQARTPNATPRITPKPTPAATPAPQPSPDIQAILTVIGRRVRSFEKENEHLDLSETNLVGAKLVRAHLEDAQLSGADLIGADLRRADLSSAPFLTQQQVNSAYGNKATKLPPGLVMPESWKPAPMSPLKGTPSTPPARP
jgi:Pentapeptide repeats (8 copies)